MKLCLGFHNSIQADNCLCLEVIYFTHTHGDSQNVDWKSSVQRLYVCARGLELLKFDKNCTDLYCFIFSFSGGGASVGGLSLPKPSRGDGTGDNFCEFWSVVKLLLLLSRGQATFERGFIMNKNKFDVNSCGSHLI